MRMAFAAAGVAVLMFIGLLGLPQMASAATSPALADPRISAVMADVPGGILLDRNHAVWPELGMDMETPGTVSLFAVGTCATGSVCVFDGYGAQGAKITWRSCGNPSVSSFTVRSIATARGTGYAQARAGNSVRATAYAGSFANVCGSVDNVRCVT